MLTFDLFTARSNLLPYAFVWAIYIYIWSIEVTCRSTVVKIILIGKLRWPPSCLSLLYFPATVLFTCIKSWFFRNHFQKPIVTKFHIDPTVEMWLVVYSNDPAPLTVRPIYSSKLGTAQMMIFSLVVIIGLEKCCITSAYLQWLCHSGERAVARGPLVHSASSHLTSKPALRRWLFCSIKGHLQCWISDLYAAQSWHQITRYAVYELACKSYLKDLSPDNIVIDHISQFQLDAPVT